MSLTNITFFERFEADILSSKKTITIRDEAEKDFQPGTIIPVSTFEENRFFCHIKINAVTPIAFDQLSDFHAQQENMTLPILKQVIQDIYPNIQSLYVISYQLVD